MKSRIHVDIKVNRCSWKGLLGAGDEIIDDTIKLPLTRISAHVSSHPWSNAYTRGDIFLWSPSRGYGLCDWAARAYRWSGLLFLWWYYSTLIQKPGGHTYEPIRWINENVNSRNTHIVFCLRILLASIVVASVRWTHMMTLWHGNIFGLFAYTWCTYLS